MTSASLRIDAGVRIGPYIVERRLGQNRASPLYLVRDESGGRAALRLIQPEVATSPVRARLKRETRALSTVDHPGVVRVCGAGEHEGAPWIAMKYVRGTGLERLLIERGPLATDVALRHAMQAAEALVAAHEAGVAHRAIRPSNLLLTSDGRLVLVNFGLAPWSELDEGTGVRDPLAGASAYSAPEQIEHGLADERSDVWALGAVLYEMVVGMPPFGRGGWTTASGILHDEPPFARHVPAPIVHVVNACLRKNSFARIATSRELLAFLGDALGDGRSDFGSGSQRAPERPSGRVSARPDGAPPISAIIPPPPRLPSVPLASALSRSTTPTARPPSSATRVALGRGRVKGTALRAGIVWFAEEYGNRGLMRVVELASPDLQTILRAKDPAFGLIASGWYDTQLVGELIELIERVASPVDPTAFGASVAEAIAHDNVGGVHRALFRLVASPSLLEANAQRLWRTYVDEGMLSVRLFGHGSFDAHITGWTRHHPSVCRTLRAMLESSLRAVGYSDLVLARTQCVALGDGHCIFGGTWAA